MELFSIFAAHVTELRHVEYWTIIQTAMDICTFFCDTNEAFAFVML